MNLNYRLLVKLVMLKFRRPSSRKGLEMALEVRVRKVFIYHQANTLG